MRKPSYILSIKDGPDGPILVNKNCFIQPLKNPNWVLQMEVQKRLFARENTQLIQSLKHPLMGHTPVYEGHDIPRTIMDF